MSHRDKDSQIRLAKLIVLRFDPLNEMMTTTIIQQTIMSKLVTLGHILPTIMPVELH